MRAITVSVVLVRGNVDPFFNQCSLLIICFLNSFSHQEEGKDMARLLEKIIILQSIFYIKCCNVLECKKDGGIALVFLRYFVSLPL